MRSLNRFRIASLVVTLLIALLFAGLLQAEIRVLIKFDESGHHIHRLVSVASINPLLEAEQQVQADILSDPGSVVVRWLDGDGSTLQMTNMEDPRLTHLPLTGADTRPTIVDINQGAYLVSGPSESTILEIRLPANGALALDAQTWQFELNL